MNNVDVTENGNGATGGGIVIIQPHRQHQVARGQPAGCRSNNANNGLFRNSTGNTGGGIAMTWTDTATSPAPRRRASRCWQPAGNAVLTDMVTNSVIANNSASGIAANGAGLTFRASNTTITGNSLVSACRACCRRRRQVLTYRQQPA